MRWALPLSLGLALLPPGLPPGASEAVPYVEAPGVARIESAAAGAFMDGTFADAAARQEIRFRFLLLEQAPVQRSALGEIFHFLASGGEALGASVINRYRLDDRLTLVDDQGASHHLPLAGLASLHLRPCGARTCAEARSWDGARHAGALLLQHDTERALLLHDLTPVRKVPIDGATRIDIEFSPAGPPR